MSIFELWLIFVALPNMGKLFFVATVVGAAFLVGSLAFYGIEKEKLCPYTFKLLPVIIVLAVITALTPGRSDIVYLVGGYIATNTKGVEKLPKNIVDATNKFLSDYTKNKDK